MIDAEGGISEAIQTNVTDEESCKSAVAKTVKLFGAVHILVNIGTQPAYPFRVYTENITYPMLLDY